MSAQHAPHDDAEAPAPADPYGIVPDDFTDAWNADTIPQALANAESAPSTTDPRAQQRCPHCLAARLTPLPAEYSTGDWECTQCNRRFETALPSQATAERKAAHAPETDRDAAKPRCRGCLSTALYPAPESAPIEDRWACTECGAGFDEPLPSRRATVRGEIDATTRAAIREARRRRDGIDERELRAIRKADVEPTGETEAVTLGEVTRE